MLQSWETLRFADHRGLEPNNVRIEGGTFLARLTRSKTLGSDKPVSSRLVVVDQEAYIRNRTWVKDGWHLLQLQPHFGRDYLLPAPSGNFTGVQLRELGYDTAFGVQSGILSYFFRGNRLFNFAFPHFWSPHSGRNFLPTASSALGISTQEKNLLGGWSARGSEQYNRLAKYRIAQTQREVVNRIWDKDAQDPLSETDSLRELAEFFRAQLIDETEMTRSIRLLSSRRYVETQRPRTLIWRRSVYSWKRLWKLMMISWNKAAKRSSMRNVKPGIRRRQGNLATIQRSIVQISEPLFNRVFYISISAKKKIRTVHRLGQCYHYVRYEYLGASLRKRGRL